MPMHHKYSELCICTFIPSSDLHFYGYEVNYEIIYDLIETKFTFGTSLAWRILRHLNSRQPCMPLIECYPVSMCIW